MAGDPRHDERLDEDLADRVREGDLSAFDELYRRHQPAARRSARWLMQNDHAADDVVADVFASMLAALRNGRGPRDHVPAYVKTAVRNRSIAHRKAAVRAQPTDHDLLDSKLTATESVAVTADTSQLVAAAFGTLAPRWQRALWMSEVEGRPSADIGAELGLPAPAVPALVYRARRSFAEAYLRQHASTASDSACRSVADLLPRYVRERASRRDVRKVEAHLEGCADCRRTVAELADLNTSLRTLPAPPTAAVAAAGAGGLLAWFATAAAIGGALVLPTLVLHSDTVAERPSDAAAVVVPAHASPVPTVAVVDPAAADPSITTAATATATATTAVAASTPPAATAPAADTVAATSTEAPPKTAAAGQPAAGTPATQPAGASPVTIPAVPPVTVGVDVPAPGVPIGADVTVGPGGVGVGVDVSLPGGAGGVGGDVSVGGGGVAVTVVPPTLPLPVVSTLPPVVVEVTLPPPVATLVDGLVGGLLGP